MTNSEIKEITKINKSIKKKYYTFELLDANENILLKERLSYTDVRFVTNGSDLKTYSINLNKIPVLLLDRAKTINVDLIRPYK